MHATATAWRAPGPAAGRFAPPRSEFVMHPTCGARAQAGGWGTASTESLHTRWSHAAGGGCCALARRSRWKKACPRGVRAREPSERWDSFRRRRHRTSQRPDAVRMDGLR
jgi:hypothetical protein